MSYSRTTWVTEETPLSAANMNNIEDGIEEALAGVQDIEDNFASLFFDTFYPVGCYFETTDATFNPGTAWGGTWVLEIPGQVHVSAGEGYAVDGALTNTSDGGAATVTLTTDEMPNHDHESVSSGYEVMVTSTIPQSGQYAAMFYGKNNAAKTSAEGNGQAHENMPPYINVYRWHRTA